LVDEHGEGIADTGVDQLMADEIAMKEEQEVEALVMSLNQEGMPPDEEMDSLLWEMSRNQGTSTLAPQEQPLPSLDTQYGSDDEEYEHIFMDVIQHESRVAGEQSQQQDPGNGDVEMDIS